MNHFDVTSVKSVSNFSIPVKESRTKREIDKKILIMLFSKRLPVDILT